MKVGGMRITQHKKPEEKPEPKVADEDMEEEEAVIEVPPKVVLSLSGVLARVCLLYTFLTN